MPRINREPQNQTEIVQRQIPEGREGGALTEITEQVVLPGMETLQNKSIQEIAGILANVLKSRNDITKLTYVVGKHIEITSKSGMDITI